MKEPTDQGTGKDSASLPNNVPREYLLNCQRLAMLGRLSTIVTHEVNNHLTGVSGYVQLMLESADAAGLEEGLGKINTSALRCQKLIREIRQVGRFTDGNREVGNINLILGSCLELVRHQFKQKSHTIVEDFSSDLPSGEFDTPAVEQMFLSMIQNSFEAFEKKGGSLRIATRVKSEGIVVTFEDDGPGISEDARENLFMPFFTTKEDLNCPGLGLAAAKMIMEDHGGTIAINDTAEAGTHVEIVFPVK
jgi:C4-dicarboxylate-specific signal transduction histidine kinase